MGNYPSGRLYRNLGFYLLFLIIMIFMISMATSFMEREIPRQIFTYTSFWMRTERFGWKSSNYKS